jgi:hypothetical protein
VGLPDGEMFAAIGADDHCRILAELFAGARRLRHSTDPCRPLVVLDDATVVTVPWDVAAAPGLPAVTLVVRSRTVAAALRLLTVDAPCPAPVPDTVATLCTPETEEET